MTDQFKNTLRDTIKRVRSKVSVTYRATASKIICTRIHSTEAYRNAKKIALYIPIHGEIDVTPLWHHAPSQNKSCYFPVLQDDSTLAFLPATVITPFKKNQFGIPEPDMSLNAMIPLEELDLIIVPLVAFDIRCTRLGMGAGYYDRTLKEKRRAPLFGVAFQFQFVDFIEPQPWDIPMDAVITQKALYWRNPLE